MNNTSAANVSQTNDQSSSKDATSKTEGIVSFSALILTSVLTVAGNTYIGRLSIKHCQREHTALLFLYCGSLLSLFLRY